MASRMTRRGFVKSVGAGAALTSMLETPAIARGTVQAIPLPASKDTGLLFRQVHLDFHTSPLIDGVGSDFSAKDFVATLKAAHVNSINIFAKCHHGMSYYPTKVGEMHPHLHFDLLGSMIQACRAESIRTPVYMSIMWDMRCAELHADWRCLDAVGKQIGANPLEAGWMYICPNSPYGDYIEAQAEEIAARYDADGFWFDIVVSPRGGCFCPYCMAERERSGLDSTKSADREKQYLAVLDRTMARLTAAVRRHRPQALIYFNGRLRIGEPFRQELKFFTHLEIESLPGGHWGYGYFGVMARYTRNLGLDYLGMTGRFHRSWGDFGTLRNQAALDYECLRMLAHAGKCSIGDQLHPRGRLVSAVYQRIGETYRAVEEREPWCAGAKAVTEIGSVSDAAFQNSGDIQDSDLGVTRMLGQLQQQFDLLDWSSDFTKYKLLILPDSHTLDARRLNKLQAYLRGGGTVILSHRSGLDAEQNHFALQDAAVIYEGPSPYVGDKGDYFKVEGDLAEGIPDMVHFSYGAGSMVQAKSSSLRRADIWKPYFDRDYLHFSSHAQTVWEAPVSQAAVVESGRVLYISFPIFENYARNSYAPHKTLVKNCIAKLLPNPLLRVTVPSTAEVTMTEQSNRKIVHLLHYPAERRGVDLDVVEDVIPLVDVPLWVRSAKPPRQVYTAPDRKLLKVEFQNGYAHVVVPKVSGHAMVVLET